MHCCALSAARLITREQIAALGPQDGLAPRAQPQSDEEEEGGAGGQQPKRNASRTGLVGRAAWSGTGADIAARILLKNSDTM